jgi:dienelactone hydrolase
MFGLSDGVTENTGNGEHLASWGYVTAIPALPDEIEDRIEVMQTVLSFLESQTATPGSFLYGKVDPDRLSAVGHSLGGATALLLAARDDRVTAVVALDPVYHSGDPTQGEETIWNPEEEGPEITVPTAILGAQVGSCNSQGDYIEIYSAVGATHKGQYYIVGASHCDFADPGNSMCYLFCGDESDPTGVRTQLIQKTMTAWFNYYLHVDAGYFTYLYGDDIENDVQAGVISPTIHTAPRSFSAITGLEAVYLTWELYEHSIITGYRIYRTQQSGVYSNTHYAQTGRESSYADMGVLSGDEYFYVIRSTDLEGNEHQASAEVHASPWDHVYLPLILKSE